MISKKDIEFHFARLDKMVKWEHDLDVPMLQESAHYLREVFDVGRYVVNFYRSKPSLYNETIVRALGIEGLVDRSPELQRGGNFGDGPVDTEEILFGKQQAESLMEQLGKYDTTDKRKFFNHVKKKLLNISVENKDILKFYILLLKKIKTYNRIIFAINEYLVGKKDILKYFLKYLVKMETRKKEWRRLKRGFNSRRDSSLGVRVVAQQNTLFPSETPLVFSPTSPTPTSRMKSGEYLGREHGKRAQDFTTDRLARTMEYQKIFIPINIFKIFLNMYDNRQLFLHEFKQLLKRKLLRTVFNQEWKHRRGVYKDEMKAIEMLKEKFRSDEFFGDEEVLLNDFRRFVYDVPQLRFFLISNSYWKLDSPKEGVLEKLHWKCKEFINSRIKEVRLKFQRRQFIFLPLHSNMTLVVTLNGHSIMVTLNLFQASMLLYFFDESPRDMAFFRPLTDDEIISNLDALLGLNLVFQESRNSTLFHLNENYEPMKRRILPTIQRNEELEKFPGWQKKKQVTLYLLKNFKALNAVKIYEKLKMVMDGFEWTVKQMEDYMKELESEGAVVVDEHDRYSLPKNAEKK